MESKCRNCAESIVTEINMTDNKTEIQSFCTLMNVITNNTVKNCNKFTTAIRTQSEEKWINYGK